MFQFQSLNKLRIKFEQIKCLKKKAQKHPNQSSKYLYHPVEWNECHKRVGRYFITVSKNIWICSHEELKLIKIEINIEQVTKISRCTQQLVIFEKMITIWLRKLKTKRNVFEIAIHMLKISINQCLRWKVLKSAYKSIE